MAVSQSEDVSSGPSGLAGGPSGALNQDIPPDMALLLQQLEDDFNHKVIDQWTYINRREEIMRLVSKLHEAQQQEYNNTELSNAELQPPLLPRKQSPIVDKEYENFFVNILQQRAAIYKTEMAFTVLDGKGKEIYSISWEKLYTKAVRIAMEIRHKTSLSNSDTVVLLYKDGEVVEFTVALFACFLAKVVAIPIHQDIALSEVLNIINFTSSKLLLYSDAVAKDLEKVNNNSSGLRIQWPSKLQRLRTTEFGSAKKTEISGWLASTKKSPKFSDLAYVEFSRSPLGELRGIALSHRTIYHQMHSLNSTLLSMPNSQGDLQRSAKEYRRGRCVVLATLDIRFSIGIIIGILFTVYSGNNLIWAPQKVMEVQGLYANIVSKCRASLLLGDYFGLKRVTYDYQKAPNETRYYSKTQAVDFSCVKWVLINALTIDGEFLEILMNRYLRPLGCQDPANAILPMLTLSEYGGMVISMRDWLGKKDRLGITDMQVNEDENGLSSVLIDKESLARNIVKVVDTNPPTDDITQGTLRVDAFGYPLPDAILAVVNPELCGLARQGELGEIWIDSPCLSGGFYGMRKESRLIFHAKCHDANGPLEMDFLRTGLLGFTFNGKVYILGLYEDRIRQKVSWLDQKIYNKLGKELVYGNGTRYHYSSHLLTTLASEVKQLYDCTIFDIFIGNEYLPVAIVEAEVIKKPLTDTRSGDYNNNQGHNKAIKEGEQIYSAVPLNEAELNAISQRCFDTLYKHHCLRLYCVLVVDCDTLPKIWRSGGKEIASMLCKKKFLEGSLKAEYVRFFVRKSLSMIPHGEDVIGGIWSPYVSELRSMALANFPPQYSSIDYKDKSIDERTGAILTDFKSILDILKFRVASSGDSIAFHTLENFKGSSKPLTWKKFEQRVYAVCHYLIEKSDVRAGGYVILMYSLSEEFIVALYACLMCGIIAIPMLPFDSNRIGEDYPAFLGAIRDFDVHEILVNEEVEKFLKNGPIADSFKKFSSRYKNLKVKNTAKVTKVSNVASLNSKIAKYQAAVDFRDENTVAMVWLNFTSDYYRVGAALSHKSIVGICKVFKETLNLSNRSVIIGCVRHSAGIGLIQSALLGPYLGTTTYLMSPVTYAESPLSFFLALSRHKVKDVFVTEQMLKYAAIKFTPKGFNLSELKNMMISTEGRVEIDMLRKIAKVFLPTKLSAASMASVYCHFFNPIISTRSYMSVAPVDLFLDPIALRQGYVSVVNQVEVPSALHIQDSGMVPVCTEIAIVNPETCKICKEGEFGEIWVCSEANLAGFTNGPKGPSDQFTSNQFMGKIVDGNPNMTYLRTGDLGFLYDVTITRNIKNSDNNPGEEFKMETQSFRPLFVLGKISDTFEIMGLHHFPIDIERTIESCHPDIYRNGSCVFKCAEYTIVVCESKRSRYFASLVPLLVNTILSKHHLVVDIVAFIKKGEFPISRLGTKQRARIIDAWVGGVIPILAAYGVNYGENSMIQLVKEIDDVARDNPITSLKNPAVSYYEDDDSVFDPRFSNGLTLNQSGSGDFHKGISSGASVTTANTDDDTLQFMPKQQFQFQQQNQLHTS